MTTLPVHSPAQPYSVHIEQGLRARAGSLIAEVVTSRRAMLVMDGNIAATHGQTVARSMHASGFDASTIKIHASEANKSLETAQAIYAAMLDAGIERGSPVIAVGGGIIGDLAGFAAATFMRGVPLIHVPTTLLAMVDASIGGKTAVNFAKPDGALVKNVVGSFWQPRLVIVDPDALVTLDDRDFRCGLAECVKHAMIADVELFHFLEQSADAICGKDLTVVQQLIERSASVKIAIVERDEHEQGDRAWLNLGHTYAHAIESFTALDLRHGEAVAIGLCAASHCSGARGLMTSAQHQRVPALLKTIGLPTNLPRPVTVSSLMDAMRHDKKIQCGRRRLILPIGLGAARIVDDLSHELLAEGWLAVGAAAK